MNNIVWAYKYLKDMRKQIAWGIVLIFFSMCLELMQTVMQKYVVDEIVYDRAVWKTVAILLGLLFAHIGGGLLFYKTGTVFHEIFYFWRSKLINSLYCRIQETNIERADKERIAEMTLLIGDVEGVGEDLYWIPFRLIDVVKIILIALWIGHINYIILIILIGVSVLSIIVTNVLSSKIHKGQSTLIEERYKIHTRIEEGVSGTREILSNNYSEYYLQKIERNYSVYMRKYRHLLRLQNYVGIISVTLKWCGIFIAVFVAWKMLVSNQIGVGTFYVLYQFTSQFLELFHQNINNIVGLFKADAKVKKLREMMDKYEVVERCKGIELKEPINKIEFLNAKCGYDAKVVLDDFSEHICIGKKNAVIGKSGSGKSTLVEILVKNYDLLDGKCLVNGKYDLKDLSHYSWMKKVSVVFQDSYIFNTTIRENIVMGKEVSDDFIWEVCKEMCIDEYIKNLPNGLDEEIYDRGMNMSGGQRQRLALVRAIVRNPEIMIMDEATSSLDENIQRKVQESIDRLFANKTTIVVAHRMTAVENAGYCINVDCLQGEKKYV
ncbi:MAG: ABC transporter ATP-binding protein [Lachnospiraceae bacterium]|nr:ABC transporter ATP-binding protein [Lachnospiraceae bacterium]